jgi:hypothetical protein
VMNRSVLTFVSPRLRASATWIGVFMAPGIPKSRFASLVQRPK